jgi:hypothetical protein
MRWVAALLLMALPAHANTLIFQFWPTTHSDDAVFCSIDLDHGRFTAVEMKGMKMGNPVPLRWYARADEVTAMTAVMTDFVTGTIPTVATQSAVLPPPPFVSVTYWVPYDDGVRSGALMLSGQAMPARLRDLIRLLMPGGLCAQAVEQAG